MSEKHAYKLAQAYQILGELLMGNPNPFNKEAKIKVLDYFSDEDAYDEDFLPVGEIEKEVAAALKEADD